MTLREICMRRVAPQDRRMALLLALCIPLHACGRTGETVAHDGKEGRTLLVCGVDRSGSIRMRDEALDRCGELLESVPRGRATVRWISGTSYRANETIVDVALASPPRCTNPYAPRCRLQREAHVRADRAVRDSALAVLHAATAPPAQSTDIVGYVAAAADWLHAAGPADHRIIALATDLIDNAGRRLNGLDLRGVDEILVWQQADDDPARAYRRRSLFERLVVAAGAEPPRFVPLTMRANP